MSATDGHHVHLLGRTELEITGVTHVHSFDVRAFELATTSGALHIEGDGLHIKHFDLQSGVVRIEGKVTALAYNDEGKRRNLVGRLLR